MSQISEGGPAGASGAPIRLARRLLAGPHGEDLARDLAAEFLQRRRSRRWTHRITAVAWLWVQLLPLLGLWLRRGFVRFGRDAGARRRLDGLAGDLRQAMRFLVAQPRFTLPATGILAVGIGLLATLFAIVQAVLLAPLPYLDPGELVLVRKDATARGGGVWKLDPNLFAILRESASTLRGVEGHFAYPVSLQTRIGVETVAASRVSGGFFKTLGVDALVGRSIVEGDRNVIVLSHGLWRSAFGADEHVVGASVMLEDVNPLRDTAVAGDAESFTIVGVMPAAFSMPTDFGSPVSALEAWIPLHLPEAVPFDFTGVVGVVARLADGVTLQQSAAEIQALYQPWPVRNPGAYEDVGLRVVSMHDFMLRSSRQRVLLLAGAGLFLLLIVVSNITNLFVTSALARARELALRRALGASRRRLLRLAVAQCGAVCVVGGAAGLLAARILLPSLLVWMPAGVARLDQAAVDVRVVAAIGFVLGLLALLFGAFASLAGLARPTASLAGAAFKTVGAGRLGERFQAASVVLQVGLTVLLLFGSALMLDSIRNLTDIEPGYSTDNRIVFNLFLPQGRYPSKEAKVAATDELYATLAALPGVVAVGGSDQVPPVRYSGVNPFASDQHSAPMSAGLRTVTRGYPAALGLELVEGRMFDERDGPESAPVVMVTEETARRLWPEGRAIGQELWIASYEPWGRRQVVGVVRTVATYFPDGVLVPEVYQLHEQDPWNQQRVVIHSEQDPLALAASIRAAVAAFDPLLPVSRLRRLGDDVDVALSQPRFIRDLLTLFTVAGLLLAAVATFGVMSHAVAQRIPELSVRAALGASPRQLARVVLGKTSGLAGLGAALGALACIPAARLIEAQLYRVSIADPTPIAIAVASVILVALAASLPVCRRAAELDPVRVLRQG